MQFLIDKHNNTTITVQYSGQIATCKNYLQVRGNCYDILIDAAFSRRSLFLHNLALLPIRMFFIFHQVPTLFLQTFLVPHLLCRNPTVM